MLSYYLLDPLLHGMEHASRRERIGANAVDDGLAGNAVKPSKAIQEGN